MSKIVRIGKQIIDPHNPGVDRPVVIKEFDAENPGAERALEMLSYGFNCFPKLYQIEKTENKISIYQEYIDGKHLFDLVPKTLEEILIITCEIASSLKSVHEHAEAIRDITPDNIIFRDGKAFFVDLSTTDMEFTPGYKPPEVDGSISSGYSRATDVYQFGIIVNELQEKSGVFNNKLISLAKKCLSYDGNDRPSIGDILQTLIEIKRKRKYYTMYYKIFISLSIVAAMTLITFSVYNKKNSIRSMEDVISLRLSLGDSSHTEVLEAASKISEFIEKPVLLDDSRVEAIFVTKIPMIISDGEIIGIGSNVKVEGGKIGYVIEISLDAVKILTSDGIIEYKTRIQREKISLSKYDSPAKIETYFNIAIWPKPENLDRILLVLSKYLNLTISDEIKGGTAGLYHAESLREFLEINLINFQLNIIDSEIFQYGDEPPLFFPVINASMRPSCIDFEKYLGRNVVDCELLEGREVIFSYRNTLDGMLNFYNLKLIWDNDNYKIVMRK